MIKKYVFLAFVGIAVSLSSCKKDSDEVTGSDPFDAKYIDLSADSSKASIEDNGVEFTQAIGDMSDLDAMKIAVNLASLMSDNIQLSNSVAFKKGLTPINILSAIGKNSASAQTISNKLKSATEGPDNLVDAWDQIAGVYEYNPDKDDFDTVSLGGDQIIIKFPGLETDVTNTAQIKIYNFDYKEITEDFYAKDEDTISLVGQQLPTSLKTDLSYEGTVLVTWTFSAAYQNNGMPTSFSSEVVIDPFSFSVKLTHDPYSQATYKYSFKKADKVLLETYAEMNGNWSQSNIEDNIEKVVEEGDYYTEEYTKVYFENIVKNANAYFQILNIKVAGKVNFNALIPVVRDLQDKISNEEISQKQYADAMVDAINDNAKLVVVTADKNEMIAKVEIYTYYDEVEDYWVPSAKFIFSDGSSIDADTYVENGDYREDFGGLIDEINDLINQFNYDYGADIPNIE